MNNNNKQFLKTMSFKNLYFNKYKLSINRNLALEIQQSHYIEKRKYLIYNNLFNKSNILHLLISNINERESYIGEMMDDINKDKDL